MTCELLPHFKLRLSNTGEKKGNLLVNDVSVFLGDYFNSEIFVLTVLLSDSVKLLWKKIQFVLW